MQKKRVLLGMSGGVDSSMCAWYLQQQDYEVVGITFNTLSPLSSDESKGFINEAKQLAQKLEFEHHTIDVYDDFKREIIDYFVDEYASGRTPNPCVRCNVTIKWKLLLEYSKKLNCEKIATGHYVNVVQEDGLYYIQKGLDSSKDQSYFLWNLNQEILERCVFPLGSFLKKDVKEKAHSIGFKSLSSKKESMGVCFLQGTDYRDFIRKHNPQSSGNTPGSIVNNNGEIVGAHDGVANYTIGQKRGLQLTKNHGEYVAQIDAVKNTLLTAPKNHLFSDHLTIEDFMMVDDQLLTEEQQVDIRIRGLDAVPPTPGTIGLRDGLLHVQFSEPVWAITPGQSIVFYKKNLVIGGGFANQVEFNVIK